MENIHCNLSLAITTTVKKISGQKICNELGLKLLKSRKRLKLLYTSHEIKMTVHSNISLHYQTKNAKNIAAYKRWTQTFNLSFFHGPLVLNKIKSSQNMQNLSLLAFEIIR